MYKEKCFIDFKNSPEEVSVCSTFNIISSLPGRISMGLLATSRNIWKSEPPCFESLFISSPSISFVPSQILQIIPIDPVGWLVEHLLDTLAESEHFVPTGQNTSMKSFFYSVQICSQNTKRTIESFESSVLPSTNQIQMYL